jgi:rhamnosyltransferase
VDDGATIENKELFKNHVINNKIIILHNQYNIGIAGSLNRGIEEAIKKGYLYYLLLDDDSTIKNDMTIKLCYHLRNIKSHKTIGLIGMDWETENDFKIKNKNNLYVDKRGIITSGCLLSKDIYDKIGKFREEFIIDMVDYEYALRCRKHGYRVIKINEIGFIHGFGKKRDINLFGKQFHIYTHSAERLYYSQRNSTVLAKEYFKHDPLYSLAVFFFQIKSLLQIILFETDKFIKLYHMFRGYIDGWRGKLGKIAIIK